jgi:uncharacterized damage-inducible protein DinB
VGAVNDAFLDVLAGFAALDEASCAEPWQWPGHSGETLMVRNALYQSLLEEQEAAVTARRESEAARILCLAQEAFGVLRGLLIGLDDGALDRSPGGGAWTLREVLAHVLNVERSYYNQTLYASRRSNHEPVYTQQRPPPAAGDEVAGGVRGWIERLASARARSFELAALPAASLTRPTRWSGHDVDIRFRLHRFAVHIAEHTNQCEKVLQALGIVPREGWLIARQVSEVRGSHELVTPSDSLTRLNGRHAERLRSIAPANRRA